MKFDKISFGCIQICSFRIQLTFKLQKRAFDFDISNSDQAASISSISPLLTNFASIQDARLSFNEIVILEGFFSQEILVQNIKTHYITEGTKMALKLVGSSDMFGNPVGLFSKIGLGFVELQRDPSAGMKQGTYGFVKGIGKGLQGVVKGVVGGTFDSLDTLSGSMYSVIKEITWGQDKRQRRQRSGGIVDMVKGVGEELADGVTGVFTKPYAGAKEAGLIGFSKGVGKGVVGLAVTPLTVGLRSG